MAQQKVSEELATTIEKMRELLDEEFGCDYAFSVLGRGHMIAASNNRAGKVIAEAGEQLPSIYF